MGIPFALLWSYKIFPTAVNNIKVCRSLCKVLNIVFRFQPNMEPLENFREDPNMKFMKLRPVEAAMIHTHRRTRRSEKRLFTMPITRTRLKNTLLR